jgi:hypothetical protein
MPPAPGHAWADERLQAFGVRRGRHAAARPGRGPGRRRRVREDTNYLLQGALWVEPGTWRAVQNASGPTPGHRGRVPGDARQRVEGDAASLAAAVDATGGATTSLTKDEAVDSLPGTREQRATFTFIIAATFLVALLVVALFFALLVRERTGLYGVLKAVGASTPAAVREPRRAGRARVGHRVHWSVPCSRSAGCASIPRERPRAAPAVTRRHHPRVARGGRRRRRRPVPPPGRQDRPGLRHRECIVTTPAGRAS